MSRVEHWETILQGRAIEPIAVFEGDEAIGAEEYTATIYNWYNEHQAIFVAGAQACGVDLKPENMERSRRIVAAACWLDEYLDRPGEEMRMRAEYFGDAVQQIYGGQGIDRIEAGADAKPELAMRPELRNALRLMDNATGEGSGFDPDARNCFLMRAKLIGNSVLRKAYCTDPEEYMVQVRLESDATADIISGSMLDGLPQTSAEIRYERVMRTMMRGVVLLDHAYDLPNDYEEGRTRVEPSIGNRLRMARSAVSEYAHRTFIAQDGQSNGDRLSGDWRPLGRMFGSHLAARRRRLDGGKAPALPAGPLPEKQR